MTAIVAIVCVTLLALSVLVGIFHERHRRFWLDRSVDELKLSLAAIRRSVEVKDATIEALERRIRDLEMHKTFRG